MDNARPHVANYSRTFLINNNNNYFKTPISKSPDLNPIEMVWHDMKVNIREEVNHMICEN